VKLVSIGLVLFIFLSWILIPNNFVESHQENISGINDSIEFENLNFGNIVTNQSLNETVILNDKLNSSKSVSLLSPINPEESYMISPEEWLQD
jgi:hypothetical protein